MGVVVAEPEVEGEDKVGVEVDMEAMKETIGETIKGTTKRTFKVSGLCHICLIPYLILNLHDFFSYIC